MDGIFEYCGIQRTGKSTLLTADLLCKLLNKESGYCYEPKEVYSNYRIDIKGINCLSNEDMLAVLLKANQEKWIHKVFVIDECSQPPLFYARNTRDKIQTELVTSLWQFPKLFRQFLYSSNIGNSVDVQQRDATHITIMPIRYELHPENRELEKIEFRVIHAYEQWFYDDVFLEPAWVQNYFDSFRPIE